MNIVALMGKLKSGKDTIGGMVLDERPGEVVQMAFADKLKSTCMDLFGLSWEDVYTEEGKARNTPFESWTCPACKATRCHTERVVGVLKGVCDSCNATGDLDGFRSYWTNRAILQHVGTEGCRFVDPNVWVNFVLRAAEVALTKGVTSDKYGRFTPKLVIVTDCRFKSEADAVWKAGGEVWRVKRPSTDRTSQGIAMHASETEMDSIPETLFQEVMVNDHTLEQLRDRTKSALSRFFDRAAHR